MACTCEKCGKKYRVDLVIPDLLWIKISPKQNEAGLLCGSCIMEELEKLNKYICLDAKNNKEE